MKFFSIAAVFLLFFFLLRALLVFQLSLFFLLCDESVIVCLNQMRLGTRECLYVHLHYNLDWVSDLFL